MPTLSFGAEGLEATHGRDLWLATRGRFAEGLVYLLRHPGRAAVLATHARELVKDRYDWSAIGRIACAAVAAAAASRADTTATAAAPGAIEFLGSGMVS